MGWFRKRSNNDAALRVVPFWGPDTYSVEMATANAVYANPFSPASRGPGLFGPAPGSVAQGTKSDTWLEPRQNFRGLSFVNPPEKFQESAARFPAASVAVNPVLLSMSNGPDTSVAGIYARSTP